MSQTFVGNWTESEKQIVAKVIPQNQNPWYLYRSNGGFSAHRQSWDSGGLYGDSAEDLAAKITEYYSR